MQNVLCCTDTSIIWIDNPIEENAPFVGMVQVYTNKTATILKANAIVAHTGHIVLLNSDLKFCRYLIYHGHTLF